MLNTHETNSGSRKHGVTKQAAPYLAARCTKRLKKQLRDAKKSTGLDESDFIIAAITDWLESHKTPEAKIAAISRFRVAAVS